MLDRLQTVLQVDCRLDPAKPVLAGISGGPDSMCLLDILTRLRYPVIVAHLNHGLRPEAHYDAKLVERVAGSLGAPFVYGEEDVTAYSLQNALSIEEAARDLRYRFLFSQARRYAAQAVVVGHTADDQVETILMHFLRGAGLAGLKGMVPCSIPNPWSREIPLVRPLLDVWREEILHYLQESRLEVAFDQSNLDVTYYRNRLRKELIPLLETYNPGVKLAIWRTGKVLAQDYQVIQDEVESAWEDGLLSKGPDYLSFSRPVLLKLPEGILRQVLRKATNELRPGLRDVDYESMARAVAFLRKPTQSGQADWIAGLKLLLEGDRLWLAAWGSDLPQNEWPQALPGETYTLDVPGRVDMQGDWSLETRFADLLNEEKGRAVTNRDPHQAWVDVDGVSVPLGVRTRRARDRFEPLGMGGRSLKLSDFLINVKMPRRARQAWPLIVSGEDILWVPGYQIGHPFRLKEETRRAIHLKLVKRA